MVKVGSYVYFALNQIQYVELFPNMRAQTLDLKIKCTRDFEERNSLGHLIKLQLM